MMKPKSSSSGFCVGLLLLRVITAASEKWTVTVPMEPLVATIGGQAELSCQLSPPQSAKRMEVSWFKGNHSRLVHLYRDGDEVEGEAAPEYADRTEFVKEALEEGRVTLRLHNVSVSDHGTYRCSFKDGNFGAAASVDLGVSALGRGTQIYVHAPGTNGLVVEWSSEGWFPRPHPECKDGKGEAVPPSSNSYSEDGAGLFYVKMTLLLRNKSQGNLTCYIQNPLSSEGKHINIVLADSLFDPVHIWLIVTTSFFCVVLLAICMLVGCQCFKTTGNCCNRKETFRTSLLM